MNNKHFIECKFIGPTNTRNARVKLIDARFKQSITVAYDHEYNGTFGNAVAWLESHGYSIESNAETKDGYGFMCREFVGIQDAAKGERWEYAPKSPGEDLRECLREMITVMAGNHRDSAIRNPWCRPAMRNAAKALRNADGLDPFKDPYTVRYTSPDFFTPESV